MNTIEVFYFTGMEIALLCMKLRNRGYILAIRNTTMANVLDGFVAALLFVVLPQSAMAEEVADTQKPTMNCHLI